MMAYEHRHHRMRTSGTGRPDAAARQVRSSLGGVRTEVARWTLVCGSVGVGVSLFASPATAKPDVSAGEKHFAACAACHAPDLSTKTGPDLRGVVGRKVGAVPGFRYSRALKTAGVSWDDARLDAFLAEPQTVFPGNAMPFPGLPDAKQRLDLIAYLKTLR